MRYFVFHKVDYRAFLEEFETEKETLDFIEKLAKEDNGDYDGNKILSVFHGEEMEVRPIQVVTMFELVKREQK